MGRGRFCKKVVQFLNEKSEDLKHLNSTTESKNSKGKILMRPMMYCCRLLLPLLLHFRQLALAGCTSVPAIQREGRLKVRQGRLCDS